MSEPKQAPISACLIVRNELANIERCLQSIRPYVKEIVVVDTGSDDGTPEIAKKYADIFEVFTACNDENNRINDFSLARQRSFDLATQPWAMWIDGDDVLDGADKLAEIVAAHDHLEKVCVMWNYDYDHDDAGNITMKFTRERLVKPPREFKWISPVHETLVPQDPSVIKILIPDGIKNVHRRRDIAKTVESGRNLRILQTHYNKVGDTDVRALYYLGLELGWTGNPEQAIEMHKKYIEKSGWEDEKYLSILEVCRHYQGMAKWDEAIEWALKAIPVRETWGEAFYSLSKSYYYRAQQTNDRRDWERSVNFARKYLASPPTQTVLFINPMERKVEVHRYLVMACMQIGDSNGALASCEEILKTLPGDENTLFNVKVAKGRSLVEQARAVGQELHRLGSLTDQALQLFNAAIDGKFKARPVDQSAATVASSSPAVVMKRHSGLDIVLYIGPGAERWTPETIAATGIGGSERMAWEMARRLARLGNRVRVYGDCDKSDTFEGVEWFNHLDYHHLACDVLITSRRPIAVEDQFQVQAKLRLCWVHDVHCGAELTQQRALKIDRFLALSEWHRQFFLQTYDFIPSEQVIKTRNGIDLSLYATPEERNPHRMFYSSSPDRGLYVALEAMPEIRRRVPDAELHVYYGFDVWERFAPPEQKQQIQFLKGLIEQRKGDGVVYHGRVSPPELAAEQSRSGVHAYPTWFCCHPDTRISVPGDHRGGPPTVRIADMVGKSGFPVYAFNEEENRFEIRTCTKVWETKIADEIVELDLDSGETLKVTPDHRVLTFDGDWVEAGTLKEGDSLRALHYRYNVAIRDGNGRWTDEHRLVGEWKEGRRLRRDEHVDHTDLKRLDNRPEALTVMTASEHFSKTHKGKRLSKKHIEKKRLASMAAVAAMSPERKAAWHSAGGCAIWAKVRALPPAEQETWLAKRRDARRATIALKKATVPGYAEKMREQSRINGAKAHAQRYDNPTTEDQLPIASGDDRWGRNHKVVAVRRVKCSIPVYDMEVEGLHNFVADGVVVHNCETSCITAMEAQAAGCRIVTSPIAALNETVGNRGTMIDGNWLSPEYRAQFIDACVAAMVKPEDGDREALKQYARDNFGLDSLARDWHVMLVQLISSVSKNPVIPYRTSYARAA